MKGIMVLPLLTICLTAIVDSQQTGIVYGQTSGQQSQNSSSQYGNDFRDAAEPRSAPPRSVTDNGASYKNSTEPAQDNLPGPLEMTLDDQLITAFKRQGQMEAPIEPRQFVNGIVFLYDRNSNVSEVSGVMTPVSKKDGVLAFELSEFDLETLKKQGLKYNFDRFEMGRYESVRIDYRPAGSAASNNRVDSTRLNSISRAPVNNNSDNFLNERTNNRVDSRLTDNGFGGSSTRQTTNQSGGYLPTPAPDFTRPGDPNFMGPYRNQGNQGNQNYQNTDNRTSSNNSNSQVENFYPDQNNYRGQTNNNGNSSVRPNWEPTPNPGNQTANQFDNRNGSNFNTSSQRQFPPQDFNTSRPQDNANRFDNNANQANGNSGNSGNSLLADTNRRQWETEKRLNEEQDRSRMLEQRLAELERNNFAKSQPPYDRQQNSNYTQDNSGRQFNNGFGPSNNQSSNGQSNSIQYSGNGYYDNNNSNDRPFDRYQTEQNLNYSDSNYPNSNDANANYRNSSYAERLASSGNGWPSQRNNSNLSPQTISENNLQDYRTAIQGPPNPETNNANNSMPDRYADGRGKLPYQGSSLIGQNDTVATTSSSTDVRLMYFMLMFSLGLNVYLGIISRGFYVRYSELADELRETFTATM